MVAIAGEGDILRMMGFDLTVALERYISAFRRQTDKRSVYPAEERRIQESVTPNFTYDYTTKIQVDFVTSIRAYLAYQFGTLWASCGS